MATLNKVLRFNESSQLHKSDGNKKKSSNITEKKSIESENITEKEKKTLNWKSFCVHFPTQKLSRPEKKNKRENRIESWCERNRFLSNIFRRAVDYISANTAIPHSSQWCKNKVMESNAMRATETERITVPQRTKTHFIKSILCEEFATLRHLPGL